MTTSWDSEDWFWKRTVIYSAVAIAVVAAAGAYYYFGVKKSEPPPEVPAAVAPVPEAPPLPEEPQHHPIETPAAPDKPLPKLAESDPDVSGALSDVFGGRAIDEMLIPERVIRRIVVTVDNLPRNKVAEQMRPVRGVGGTTAITTSGDTMTLSEENFARYAPVMALIRNTDTKQLGEMYIRYYPLFQQSYEDLGYPGQYFNDRLVEVIDHLLQTPDLKGPIELKQGHVFYEYADPSLESRSAGQKLLMRMGGANAAVIKKKLRALREVVTTSRDPPRDAAGNATQNVTQDAASSPSQPTVRPDAVPDAEAARSPAN